MRLRLEAGILPPRRAQAVYRAMGAARSSSERPHSTAASYRRAGATLLDGSSARMTSTSRAPLNAATDSTDTQGLGNRPCRRTRRACLARAGTAARALDTEEGRPLRPAYPGNPTGPGSARSGRPSGTSLELAKVCLLARPKSVSVTRYGCAMGGGAGRACRAAAAPGGRTSIRRDSAQHEEDQHARHRYVEPDG